MKINSIEMVEDLQAIIASLTPEQFKRTIEHSCEGFDNLTITKVFNVDQTAVSHLLVRLK